MREHKYRGWHKESNTMLYDEKPGDVLRWKAEGQEIEVMQYTGLKDKNGKEIYEGDIAVGEQSTYSVHWDDRMAQFQAKIEQTESVLTKHCSFPLWQYVKDGRCRFEVIGNKWDNPELLEVQG